MMNFGRILMDMGSVAGSIIRKSPVNTISNLVSPQISRNFSLSTISLRESILQFMHYRGGAPARKARSKDKGKITGHNYLKGIVLKSKL